MHDVTMINVHNLVQEKRIVQTQIWITYVQIKGIGHAKQRPELFATGRTSGRESLLKSEMSGGR